MPSGAVPLSYGYAWATGQKLQGQTLQNTGNQNLDYTRIGIWSLGEGEWDGLEEMWDTALGRLLWQNVNDAPVNLHFHSGSDAVVGSGAYPYSTGGDQGVDAFWSHLPSGLQPLHYNRWAYYAISLKQLINNPPNTNQNDESVWADVNPIGLWRTRRCRIFDATGNMIGYAFTRNPAWHYVDLLCHRKLFPEYLIDPIAGAQELPVAVQNRFLWSALADSAAYFEEVMPNGLARFSGDYSFTQATSLQACLTQIAQNCRSFNLERSGQFGIIADKPREDVFTFTRANADAFTVSDAQLHSEPTTYVAKFKDLMPPAFATIASISCPDRQKPVVTTVLPHSAVAGDYVVIGNTGTRYDANWQVDSVGGEDGSGNVYTMTLKNRGSNYPVTVGQGGLIGFRYSRFHDRAPQFQHKQMQLAKGAVGVGIARQRNRIKVQTDFANSTWEQVARVSAYQRGVALGADVMPYIAPPRAMLKAPLFAPDAYNSGAVAIQIEPGDVVIVDDTLSAAYAGKYEVMKSDVTLTASAPGQGSQRTPIAGGVSLTLRPYDPGNYPDTVATSEPGWPTVPMLPGGNSSQTVLPLADGGSAVFFTGSGTNGESLVMPDGFSPNNLLAWASPQGFIENDGQMYLIQDCDAYTNGKLSLTYTDTHSSWSGDVNYSALSWRTISSARTFMVQTVAFVELTLAGGELIVFGKGIVASGTQVPLPPGYVAERAIVTAFPKSAQTSGHPAHGVAAWVDSGGVLHHHYQDGEGNTWEGPGQVMIVAFQNNMGSWQQSANGWFFCQLTGQSVSSPTVPIVTVRTTVIQPTGPQPTITLALAGFTSYIDSTPTIYPTTLLTTIAASSTVPNSLILPALAGMPAKSLQTMPGPNGFNIVDHPAHGVRQCYVDNYLEPICVFEDGEGNTWNGSTSTFALLCDTPNGTPSGTPAGASGTGTSWPGTGPAAGTGSTGTSGGSGGGAGDSGDDGGKGNGNNPVNPYEPVLNPQASNPTYAPE